MSESKPSNEDREFARILAVNVAEDLERPERERILAEALLAARFRGMEEAYKNSALNRPRFDVGIRALPGKVLLTTMCETHPSQTVIGARIVLAHPGKIGEDGSSRIVEALRLVPTIGDTHRDAMLRAFDRLKTAAVDLAGYFDLARQLWHDAEIAKTPIAGVKLPTPDRLHELDLDDRDPGAEARGLVADIRQRTLPPPRPTGFQGRAPRSPEL